MSLKRQPGKAAATPAGVVDLRATGLRGYRFAQPPANGWHPCGMRERDMRLDRLLVPQLSLDF
jgi:hypothetical protein